MSHRELPYASIDLHEAIDSERACLELNYQTLARDFRCLGLERDSPGHYRVTDEPQRDGATTANPRALRNYWTFTTWDQAYIFFDFIADHITPQVHTKP
jgi:hypothetical protein